MRLYFGLKIVKKLKILSPLGWTPYLRSWNNILVPPCVEDQLEGWGTKSSLIDFLFPVKLQTSKVHQFVISITWVFGAKLMTDLKLDTQNMPQNTLFVRFPQHFRCAKFLGQKITKILAKNRFYQHHCSLPVRNLLMFLFF